MAKAVFVGKEKISQIFKAIGLDVILEEELKSKSLAEYELIFAEEPIYQTLCQDYPYKVIIPLVDFATRKDSIIEHMRKTIQTTVGEEVLKNG
ncbi:MAG: hypothetical protein JSW17_03840 [Candidatus Omnitrophota bacterium]|nr:MAG: hypothetical protein JSW17_03840 [Candidatus Omnitrophota bacterium]